MAACSQGGMEHDATGVFEATEVIVSAEQAGRLMSFDVDEGDSLAAGQQVGLIDTVQLQLRAIRLGVTKEVYEREYFDGGKVIPNEEENRLQVLFDDIPPEEVRRELSSHGFHWSRRNQAWQRQLTPNAIRAASYIQAIRPRDGSDPRKLQPKHKAPEGRER